MKESIVKTVLATGVFDLLHPGHVFYLQEAKKLGDRLVVVVARDSRVIRNKGRLVIPEDQRLEMVRALKPVDDAVLGSNGDIFESVKEIKPDIIALGFDQDFDENELRDLLAASGMDRIRVERINKRFEGELVSTKRIIDKIKKQN